MKPSPWQMNLGANVKAEGIVSFRVWAPLCEKVEVKVLPETRIPLVKDGIGFFSADVQVLKPGMHYFYVLDGEKERPDPASRFQPEGVHGPSEIVDPGAFNWQDKAWQGTALKDLIFYELHVGTFSEEGTFAGAVKKIPHLKKLGITCVEVMPVAQFPGRHNWGYDGVQAFAVQNSYGGPEGFKTFVNACHQNGIAVCLDVVYNHFGPEGNYLHDYGPYFTDRYHTPWGDALNYDGSGSDAVRDFVISNALYWITEYHVDALRLDAVHGIFDFSPKHILKELKEACTREAKQTGRPVSIIAESDLNDPKIIFPAAKGGYGLDAQWSDDFHHAVHTYLTGETNGYYRDYSGLADIGKALKNGFVYEGQYSPFRNKKFGSPAKGAAEEKFVFCIQNHDQVGNRPFGDRITGQISFAMQKAAATLLVMAPRLPLIWMGQEYGETACFQYFVDHGDAALVQAVRDGRKREFASFGWEGIPDPASQKTFISSKLTWDLLNQKEPKAVFSFYQDLIALRKKVDLLQKPRKNIGIRTDEKQQWLAFEFDTGKGRAGVLISFSPKHQEAADPFSSKKVEILLHSEDKKYGGSGVPEKVFLMPPQSAVAVKIL